MPEGLSWGARSGVRRIDPPPAGGKSCPIIGDCWLAPGILAGEYAVESVGAASGIAGATGRVADADEVEASGADAELDVTDEISAGLSGGLVGASRDSARVSIC